jgi:hypothetical protein
LARVISRPAMPNSPLNSLARVRRSTTLTFESASSAAFAPCFLTIASRSLRFLGASTSSDEDFSALAGFSCFSAFFTSSVALVFTGASDSFSSFSFLGGSGSDMPLNHPPHRLRRLL